MAIFMDKKKPKNVNLAHAIEAYDGSIVLRGEHAQTGRSANKMCTAGRKIPTHCQLQPCCAAFSRILME